MHYRILFIGLLLICINVDANIWTRDNSCSYPNFPIVDTLIENMTIEQKVGQIIQPDLGSITLEEIQENQLGFVLNGGDTFFLIGFAVTLIPIGSFSLFKI